MHSPPVTGILDIGSHTIEKSVAIPSLNITEQRQKIMPAICLFIVCSNAAVLNLYQRAGDILTKKLRLVEHFTYVSDSEQPVGNTVIGCGAK